MKNKHVWAVGFKVGCDMSVGTRVVDEDIPIKVTPKEFFWVYK